MITPIAPKEFGEAKKADAKPLEPAPASSPASKILLAAALSGAPFCEKCAGSENDKKADTSGT